MKFLGTGRANVAFTTVMDIIFAKEQGAPVQSIGRYGKENNWGIFSQQGKPYTVKELNGKSVGIYNDAWTKAQLALMLKSAGLTLNDVQMVTASDDTVPLLLQKRVDVITGITNAEGTEMVTTGKQKPEFLPAIKHGVPNTPIFMLAGNQQWLKANPELAKAFIRATVKVLTMPLLTLTKAFRLLLPPTAKPMIRFTLNNSGPTPCRCWLRPTASRWHKRLAPGRAC